MRCAGPRSWISTPARARSGSKRSSRGAASADLVEKSPRAAAVVERNAAKVAKSVGRDAAIRVHRSPVSAFLGGPRGPYDLVFLDPPYDLDEGELTDALALLVPSLADPRDRRRRAGGALAASPTLPAGLVHARDKKYGDTVLWWVRAARTDGQPPCASQSR